MQDRGVFRDYSLDGAMLYFQPRSGTYVRVQRASTVAARRRAPRVAMFGITNACNLDCSFCSRDRALASTWTAADAAAVLRELCDAGVLEVAYGGGEPFAFRGFAELVAELDETTVLAQHVTTNGALLRPAMWRRFAGRFGQVRVSIYDDVDWHPAASLLAGDGQRWGANRIVDAAALATLPELLAQLAAHGCADVSLLSYVGPEAAHHLDAAGAERLAAIVADSPVACRLSVCFGDRVPLPRLPTGDSADCGAGRDFVSVTPDRRVQACSFHDRSFPGATAEQILDAWRLQQPQLAGAANRRGCARSLPTALAVPVAAAPAAAPPIAIWQAFSGNNSGECVLVAKFAAVADAEAYLAELLPGWAPEGPRPPHWHQLFVDEGLCAADAMQPAAGPTELLVIGRTVLAELYTIDDDLAELRALAWKRGAFVLPGGIHCHDDVWMLAAICAAGAADREQLLAMPRREFIDLHQHGDTALFATLVLTGPDSLSLAAARDELLRLAGERPLSVELCFSEVTEAAMVSALQRLGHRPPERPRLWVAFRGDDGEAKAAAFAHSLPGDRIAVAGSSVLVDPAPDRKRLVVLASRRGGHPEVLDGRVQLTACFSDPEAPTHQGRPAYLPVAPAVARLQAQLAGRAEVVELDHDPEQWWLPPSLRITSDAPLDAMAALASYTATTGARVRIDADAVDPVGAAVHRLFADVRH